MRKVIILILCVAMVLSFSSLLYVSTGEELVRNITDNSDETGKVKQTVIDSARDREEFFGTDLDAIDFDVMYRLYYLKDKDILNAYETSGSFADNISGKYRWIVPCLETGGEVEVVANGWAIRRGNTFIRAIRQNCADIRAEIISVYENVLSEVPSVDTASVRKEYITLASTDEEYSTPDSQTSRNFKSVYNGYIIIGTVIFALAVIIDVVLIVILRKKNK